MDDDHLKKTEETNHVFDFTGLQYNTSIHIFISYNLQGAEIAEWPSREHNRILCVYNPRLFQNARQWKFSSRMSDWHFQFETAENVRLTAQQERAHW